MEINQVKNPDAALGLYDPRFEHDNCGIGAVANIKGIKTHKTVDQALHIVENLEHRAGKDAEGKTGDGVGIMLQISHKFFKKVTKPLGIALGGEREYGVGMFFFPQDELARNQAKKMFEIIVKKEGLNFLGWREVPNCPEILGQRAADVMPYIAQGFVEKPLDVQAGLEFDRKLYVVRRVSTRECFWWGSCGCFLRIFRIRTMRRPLPWCIPAFPPIPIPAGCVPILTGLSSTTGRSIPSAGTWIG